MSKAESLEVQIKDFTLTLPTMDIGDGKYITVFDVYNHMEVVHPLNEYIIHELEARFGVIGDPVIMTSETKGIPIAYDLFNRMGRDFCLLRKSQKAWIPEVITAQTDTYTSNGSILMADKAANLEGRNFILVDDVCSTGATFEAMRRIVSQYGGKVVVEVAFFAEGSAAQQREGLIYLAPLEVYSSEPSGQ